MSFDRYLKTVSGLFFVYYQLGLLKKNEEYEYLHFLKHLIKPGDTVLDIGANLGYYSRIMAGLTGAEGRIYAVEPVKPILNVLKHNLRRCTQVTIYNYALGSEEKTIQMGNATVSAGGYFGTGQNFVMGNPAQTVADVTFEAEMKRGSLLFSGLSQIDFIKCDIEGYEKVVLTELQPLIDRHRPVLLVETEGENRSFLADFFRDKDYEIYTLQSGKLHRLETDPTKDLIIIPQEQIADHINLIA